MFWLKFINTLEEFRVLKVYFENMSNLAKNIDQICKISHEYVYYFKAILVVFFCTFMLTCQTL